jgi:hypothetical protein
LRDTPVSLRIDTLSLGVQYAVTHRQDIVYKVPAAECGICRPESRLSVFILEQDIMTKERSSRREDKKKPAMTPKEKKAAKKSKKESRDFLGTDRIR